MIHPVAARALAAALVLSLLPGGGTAAGDAPLPAPAGLPLPVALGGPFVLTDQTGARRSEADPDGRLQLLFFGYANCRAICSVALPQMAGIAAALADRGIPLRPVMVTVDPARDTVETIGPALARHSPDFVGLTGSPEDLARVQRLFAVESTLVYVDPFDGPVYAHGGFLYLLDGTGAFLTLLPPILSDDRIVDIIAAHHARRG
ncbi:MAG: SCO family protein [Gemmobacter sp.]